VVGGNDVEGLFIYSIDEEIPVKTVIKLRKIKDGTVLCTPWVSSFLFLGDD